MENILIDTDIVIEYLRSKDKSSTELIKLMQVHDLFLSSISELELYLGAKTVHHQNDLKMLFSEMEVIPYHTSTPTLPTPTESCGILFGVGVYPGMSEDMIAFTIAAIKGFRHCKGA